MCQTLTICCKLSPTILGLLYESVFPTRTPTTTTTTTTVITTTLATIAVAITAAQPLEAILVGKVDVNSFLYADNRTGEEEVFKDVGPSGNVSALRIPMEECNYRIIDGLTTRFGLVIPIHTSRSTSCIAATLQAPLIAGLPEAEKDCTFFLPDDHTMKIIMNMANSSDGGDDTRVVKYTWNKMQEDPGFLLAPTFIHVIENISQDFAMCVMKYHLLPGQAVKSFEGNGTVALDFCLLL